MSGPAKVHASRRRINKSMQLMATAVDAYLDVSDWMQRRSKRGKSRALVHETMTEAIAKAFGKSECISEDEVQLAFVAWFCALTIIHGEEIKKRMGATEQAS